MPQYIELNTADQKKLKAMYVPADKPEAFLVWIPGFAEHKDRYTHFGGWMAEQKVSFVALDLRGHGDSDGKRGFVKKFEDYFLDVDALLHWTRDVAGDLPFFLGSHSMGGLVAARYLERGQLSRPVHAAVMTSPFLGLGVPVPGWKKLLAKTISGIIPAAAVPAGLDPALLSHDENIVDAYKNDPLVFTKATARWFMEVVKHQADVISDASKIKLPIFVGQGGADQIVDVQSTRDFQAALGS
ncbi:MAG: lysophospholipase, partial [Leptospiraceae bacterium]|nr:lysophospholipase [Leptospiraceae bacterium]